MHQFGLVFEPNLTPNYHLMTPVANKRVRTKLRQKVLATSAILEIDIGSSTLATNTVANAPSA